MWLIRVTRGGGAAEGMGGMGEAEGGSEAIILVVHDSVKRGWVTGDSLQVSSQCTVSVRRRG